MKTEPEIHQEKMNRSKSAKLVLALSLASGLGIAAGTQWSDSGGLQAKGSSTTTLENMSAEVKAAVSQANNLSLAFRAISNAVLPAVVSIENRPNVAMADPVGGESKIRPSQDRGRREFRGGGFGQNPFEGTPFEELFKDGFGGQFEMPRGPVQPGVPRRSPSPRRGGGIGSGVIIDTSGVILTNNHVVAGGGTVVVKTADGREYTATEVLTDPSTDVAVIKISGASNLTAAPLGDSDAVDTGDWCLALGQPFGLESTVTAGIISATHRNAGIAQRENFLQTDAAINPGNSGGPLVNLSGEIIGLNTAIHSRGGGNDGIGFAVPSNMVKWVADQLLEEGKVRRAYLGIGIQSVDAELGETLGVPPLGGVLVTEVMEDTPAGQAGLQSGDVILEFDGQRVSKPSELQLVVERSTFGSKVPIRINRGGEELTLTYTPTERPESFGLASSGPQPEVEPEATELSSLGLEVADLTKQTAEALGVEMGSGVVITDVEPDSPADNAGLTEGAMIKQVNRRSIANIKQFQTIVSQADGDLLCLVKDQRSSRYVVIKR